jgi:hypothetical protein
MPRTATSLSGYLRLICVFALMMIGFAHQPMSAAASSSMPVYTFPDGSVATLCLPGDDSMPKQTAGGRCEACCLVNAALLSAAPTVGGIAILHSTQVKVFVREHRMAQALYPPNSGPRAPPVDPTFA